MHRNNSEEPGSDVISQSNGAVKIKFIKFRVFIKRKTLPQSLVVHALSLKTLHNNITNFVRRKKRNEQLYFQRLSDKMAEK